MKFDQDLSRRERQIMDILFSLGQATVNEIHARLPDPPAHTAIRTHLRILEEKGHLKRRPDGREFVYSPRVGKSRAGLAALRRAIDTFFEGSLEKAVGAHLADRQTDLSPEELERLIKLIRAARKGDT